MTEVVPFAYRVPRFAVEMPLDFIAHDATIQGRTCNLSETGALVLLQEPVQVHDVGRVRFRLGTLAISLAVQVTHAEFPETGFSFLLASAEERQFVRLLTRIAARSYKQL